jgi:hypothetical protein
MRGSTAALPLLLLTVTESCGSETKNFRVQLYSYSILIAVCTQQSAPDRRLGKFRCPLARVVLAGGAARSTLK